MDKAPLQRPRIPDAPVFGNAAVNRPEPSRPNASAHPVSSPAVPGGIDAAAYQAPIQEKTQEEKDQEFIQHVARTRPDLLEMIELLLQEIASDESSEVVMNGPHSIHKKEHGLRKHLSEIDFGDIEFYHKVIDHCVLQFTDTKDRLAQGKSLIEDQIRIDIGDGEPPLVARCHIVGPEITRAAVVTIAKKARTRVTIEDMVNNRTMSRDMAKMLVKLVRGKTTIVLSGASGAGKTTLLEALSNYFDPEDRVIVAEDTPELKIPVQDCVNLYSHKRRPGESADNEVSLDWLVAQANRMRPDRIIVGETRGPEFAEFLLAANSGVDGSMTTIHANNPKHALSRMLGLASRSKDSNQSERTINRDIAQTIQIVVQASLINGQHIITHIEEISPIIREASNSIATSTLYAYDRMTGEFNRHNHPSKELSDYLESRGVRVRPENTR